MVPSLGWIFPSGRARSGSEGNVTPRSVDTPAADELLTLRAKVSEFVQRACGQPPTAEHAAAIEALCRLFSEHAPVVAGLGEDEGDDDEEGAEVDLGDDLELPDSWEDS